MAEESPFKVTDRRRFTAEGETKADAPEDQPTEEEAAPPAAPPVTRPEAAASKKAKTNRAPLPPPADSGPLGRMDFMAFTASLATNALAALGALPSESAKDLPPPNPELAREYIDILSMLQQKTQGNLSREEDTAMQRMLTDLRMVYVQATRGAPDP